MAPNNAKAGRAPDFSILSHSPPTQSRQPTPPQSHSVDGSENRRYDDVGNPQAARHRFLSSAEWAIVAHSVGGIRDVEHHSPVHATNWWWPPRGLPPGLYKDVIRLRTKSFYFFHSASVLRWGLMILQLVLGAILTALGSFSMRNGTPITTLGAINTAAAGLLALLHNSGLPDRYRYDMAEFEAVEDHIKELLETRIVPINQTLDQILADCYERYHTAKATVAANMPVTYNASPTLQAGRRSVLMACSGLVPTPKFPRVKADVERNSPPV